MLYPDMNSQKKTQQTRYRTALYLRLSREDGDKTESDSIANQRTMLEAYAADHPELCIVDEFVDDGYSGANFNRPDWKRMIELVENDKVGVIIAKDMSRIGRNYLEVGLYTEMLFPEHDIRFIAVNSGVDSANQQDNDFTPFLNIINEFYVKDSSKKVKAVMKQKGESGEYLTTNPPYGYMKDPDNPKRHWIVDDEAAAVVRHIFAWCMEGFGPSQIAKKLKEAKVEIPAVHMARHGEGLNKTKTFKDPYNWGSSTVVHILGKMEYLGHTVNFKTAKHFKDKKSHYVSRDNWVVFENTQDPIITQEQYDLVQKIRANVRRYPDGWGEHHVLTGLMRCADCGAKMYVHRTSNGKRIPQYTCSAYSKVPVGTL